jgi:zinc protease
MSRNQIKCFTVLIVLLLLSQYFANGQNSFGDSIPLNSAVKHAVLDNGFTYYIFKHADPDGKIAMLFVEKAGLYNNESYDGETAHLIEHLSLRSTEHFPGGVRNYFIGQGLQRGRDIKASTGVETNYRVNVPVKDSKLFDAGLQVCRDWAKGRIYIQQDIDQEFAAVRNEATSSASSYFFAEKRKQYLVFDQHPLYNHQSRWILGDGFSIPIDTLKSFDRKWYRPDLQALIIVGDVDEIATEEKIKNLFSDLTPAIDATIAGNHLEKYDVSLEGKSKLIVINYGSTLSKPKVEIMH